MLRVIFHIPLPFTDIELPIYGYGVMVLIGFLAGTWVFQRGARRYGWDPARISDLSMWMVLVGLAGGRTFYLEVLVIAGGLKFDSNYHRTQVF